MKKITSLVLLFCAITVRNTFAEVLLQIEPATTLPGTSATISVTYQGTGSIAGTPVVPGLDQLSTLSAGSFFQEQTILRESGKKQVPETQRTYTYQWIVSSAQTGSFLLGPAKIGNQYSGTGLLVFSGEPLLKKHPLNNAPSVAGREDRKVPAFEVSIEENGPFLKLHAFLQKNPLLWIGIFLSFLLFALFSKAYAYLKHQDAEHTHAHAPETLKPEAPSESLHNSSHPFAEEALALIFARLQKNTPKNIATLSHKEIITLEKDEKKQVILRAILRACDAFRFGRKNNESDIRQLVDLYLQS